MMYFISTVPLIWNIDLPKFVCFYEQVHQAAKSKLKEGKL